MFEIDKNNVKEKCLKQLDKSKGLGQIIKIYIHQFRIDRLTVAK